MSKMPAIDYREDKKKVLKNVALNDFMKKLNLQEEQKKFIKGVKPKPYRQSTFRDHIRKYLRAI